MERVEHYHISHQGGSPLHLSLHLTYNQLQEWNRQPMMARRSVNDLMRTSKTQYLVTPKCPIIL